MDAISSTLPGDKAKAIRIAQQLILSSAEFHTWGSSHNNEGNPRGIRGYTQQPNIKEDYKTIIYFDMQGGVDSHNMLVPTGSCTGKDLHSEYRQARRGRRCQQLD